MAGLNDCGDAAVSLAAGEVPPQPIMPLLRERTRQPHLRVEEAVDLPRRLASMDSYTTFLGQYYGFYAPLEPRLAEVLRPEHAAFAQPRLVKHEWLECDLVSLGVSREAIDSLPRCLSLPTVQTPADAWGCLYVLEGATLGGQMVRREVQQRFGLSADKGSRFFTAYGDSNGVLWNEFSRALQAYCGEHPGAPSAIVASAIQTFACFDAWMRQA